MATGPLTSEDCDDVLNKEQVHQVITDQISNPDILIHIILIFSRINQDPLNYYQSHLMLLLISFGNPLRYSC